jgi:hypothetical protein
VVGVGEDIEVVTRAAAHQVEIRALYIEQVDRTVAKLYLIEDVLGRCLGKSGATKEGNERPVEGIGVTIFVEFVLYKLELFLDAKQGGKLHIDRHVGEHPVHVTKYSYPLALTHDRPLLS